MSAVYPRGALVRRTEQREQDQRAHATAVTSASAIGTRVTLRVATVRIIARPGPLKVEARPGASARIKAIRRPSDDQRGSVSRVLRGPRRTVTVPPFSSAIR